MHQSLVEYLKTFEHRGAECAYAQRRGYRNIRWSYLHVAQFSYQIARHLESRGIGKGDRVMIWGPNSAEWVAAFFGCALRGAVVVPMDNVAIEDFARRVYGQVGAKLLLTSQDHADIPGLPAALLLEKLAAAVAGHSTEQYPAVQTRAEDMLEIVFTSGTTADPKGVVLTHGNVLANLAPLEEQIRGYLKYERLFHPIRFLNLLPLSHVFGQFLGIFLPQIMGATVLFQEALSPSQVIATIRRERVSVLVAVPRMLQSLKEKIEKDLEDSDRLGKFRDRFAAAEGRHFLRGWWMMRSIHRQFGWKFWAFICGGAALERPTEDFWGRLGYAVIQGYGLTETTSLISVNHPFRLGKGSIGKVLAGREVRLGTDGEIMVRGAGVASAYWSGGQLQPVAGDEGWYPTGDIGALDDQGNLYFKGRKKQVLVTPAGMNVYPDDLEAALRQQPAIRDCVVVGLPREGNAEPCAVLILRDPHADVAGLMKRVNDSLAEYQRMRIWTVWAEQDFPRTPTQKPRTAEILQTVQKQLTAGIPKTASQSGILAELIARIRGGPAPTLSSQSNLESDLNLDSLERVELLGALEDRYQLDLSETAFSALTTVGDLERTLQERQAGRVRYNYPYWTLRWPVTWIRLAAHYLLLRPAVFLLGWPRIEGGKNLRGITGPILVVSNHIGDVDVGFIHTALPARFRHHLATATGGEALQALRTPPNSRNLAARIYDRIQWTQGVALLNLFPLPRAAGFRDSFAYAGQAVDRGFSILVFPEGHHTTDGKLRPFRAGIGLLARNLAIPVLPMRIDGLFELKRSGRKFARPFSIHVKIGSPLRFSIDSEPGEIADALQRTVENL
jgi:long-chain acyl-CoA synthetase